MRADYTDIALSGAEKGDTGVVDGGDAGQVQVGVIVVAAGSGQRLGYGRPKAEVPLNGEAILLHALRAVAAAAVAGAVCVVVPPGDTRLRAVCTAVESAATEPAVAGGAARPDVTLTVVDGGASRPESVRAGLAALRPHLRPGPSIVLVHDAARALTPPDVFRRVVHAIREGARAVIPVIPVSDTIKSAAAAGARATHIAPEVVTGTPDRATLRAVQTPQGFDAATLLQAHEAARGFNAEQAALVTDDAMLVETLGTTVYAVAGSPEAFKITTPLDLMLAEAVLARRTAAKGQS